MRPVTFFSALCAAALASAEPQLAKVFIQPIHKSNPKPQLLAEVEYDIAKPSAAGVILFEAPEIPDDATLARIGIYDAKTAKWLSSTSVASVENFARGYSPTVLLSVDSKGSILGASCRGIGVDAGQTRDFGPQAVVTVSSKGKQPELNKPVVLSPEGKNAVEEEKTLFQKYRTPTRLFCLQLLTRVQVLVVNRNRCVCAIDWGRRQEVIDHVGIRFERTTCFFALEPGVLVTYSSRDCVRPSSRSSCPSQATIAHVAGGVLFS